MTIRHMRIFAEVYRTENITQAAGQLHMTQPAVSRAIQELEQYYGVQLFERMNRRLYVTEAARSFYGHATHILETFDLMERELKDWEELGRLRIGSSISIGSRMLPGLIAEFESMYPKIKVSVSISNSHAVQQAVVRNDLDLGLVEGSVTEEDLCAEAFQQDRMLLIMHPEHPLLKKEKIRLEDLQEYDLLLREPGSAGRDYLDHLFAVHEISVTPLWESTSTRALLHAVAAGIGISILPEMLVSEVIESGEVCSAPLEGEPLIREHYLVRHKNKFITPALKDLMRLCREAGAKSR